MPKAKSLAYILYIYIYRDSNIASSPENRIQMLTVKAKIKYSMKYAYMHTNLQNWTRFVQGGQAPLNEGPILQICVHICVFNAIFDFRFYS